MTDEVEDVKTWAAEWRDCIYHSASLEGKGMLWPKVLQSWFTV